MPRATDRLDRIAVFAALCLFLGAVEYMIPKPVPFLRLGLANLPILLALGILPLPHLLILILLKVLGQALIQGTLFSYAFLLSFCGSFGGGLVMAAAHRLLGGHISLVGVSILGALAGNTCQLLLAVYLVFGAAGWMIAPLLYGIGLASSAVLGLASETFRTRSRWIRRLRTAGG
jgi:heptaprenyl diphosphate synthase